MARSKVDLEIKKGWACKPKIYGEAKGVAFAFEMSWKSFKFFDLEEVKDPDTNQAYDKLKVRDKCHAADRRKGVYSN